MIATLFIISALFVTTVFHGIALNALLLRIALFIFTLTVLKLASRSKYPFLKNISFSILIFAFFWFLIELSIWGLAKSGCLKINYPSNVLLSVNANVEKTARKPFWGDFSEVFGRWRLPNDSIQKLRCEDNSVLKYQTNSFGARDKERSQYNNTSKKRIIMLGDSFIEGIMVNTRDRLSDLLEKNTGNEHLNFAIVGASPINYYLIYKSLAKKLSHDVVIIGILPANDFEDFSEEGTIGLINYPIYRPYWKKSGNKYNLKYSLASINQSYGSLAIYDKPSLIYATKDSVYRTLSFGQKLLIELRSSSYVFGFIGEMVSKQARDKYNQTSIFEEYPKEKWPEFSYSLEKLLEESKEKKVLVLTIPILKEIKIYQKNHKNELAPKMASFLKNKGVSYIDLLPILAKNQEPESLYQSCDGHWNENGEKFVSETLLKHPVYQEIIR